MPKIEFKGLVELQGALKDNLNLDKVKGVVKANGADLQTLAQEKAQFRGHYKGNKFIKPSGNLKESIRLEITDGGMTAEVEPGAEYAAYVELGTRKMSAQPYLKPAWEVQKETFKNDMEKLMK